MKLQTAILLAALALAACSDGGNSNRDGGGDTLQPASSEASLTYYGHTRFLIDSRCATCHREGGDAPFSLSTYGEVAAKHSAMTYSLESRRMPPAGFSALSETERDLLLRWLESGAPRGEPGVQPGTPYTYFAHTKSIIDTRCATCHAPGELAPFSLTDYDSVYELRAAVEQQVDSGAMPPWPPTNHYVPLRHNRSLSGEEKAILKSWIAGGAPRGNPDEYVPPGDETVTVEFDATLPVNAAFTPTRRPDQYRCLMIDWPFDETVFVDAVNLLPDVRAQVHHGFASVVNPEDVALYDAADGADGNPGFDCLGGVSPPGARVRPRLLTVWAPGNLPNVFPEGTGMRIEPGSKIALQLHYNTLNVEPRPDRSSIQLRFVDSVEREGFTAFFQDLAWIPPGGMPIPAGDPAVTFEYTTSLALPIVVSGGLELGIPPEGPISMHTAFLHQHQLGSATSIELIKADGTEVMLVEIRDWDFDWQEDYVFEEEVTLYPGDRLRLTCTFDNTAANQQFVNGEQLEPRYVEFGEGTLDEMCVNYFFVTAPSQERIDEPQTFPPTVAFRQPQYMQQFHAGDYVPIELLVNAFRLQEPGTGHAQHGHESSAGSADHSHQSGHYHIYLDSEDDSADHLTNWDRSTFYRLPDDIPAGEHTLRVSLRDDQHEAVGVESRVTFMVLPGDIPGGTGESLIDVNLWQRRPIEEDAWEAHRPEEINCPDNAWYEEDGALEVQTGYCNYLSLVQPSQVPVYSGESLNLTLWHGPLRLEVPAEAHVALYIGGEVLWEADIEIPNPGGIYDISLPVARDIPAGTEINYHLHNHGFNTWTLLALDVER